MKVIQISEETFEAIDTLGINYVELDNVEEPKPEEENLLYDGSSYWESDTCQDIQSNVIELTLLIYKELAKGETIEVSMQDKPRHWEKYNVGDEVFVDADYRIKEEK